MGGGKYAVKGADASWWYSGGAGMVLMIILLTGQHKYSLQEDDQYNLNIIERQQQEKEAAACDEIYVVGEGETLQSIGDKCGDPFIVERNPHIHDPDDVFPGLLLKIITPTHHT